MFTTTFLFLSRKNFIKALRTVNQREIVFYSDYLIELIPSVEVNEFSQKANIARNKMLTLVRNPQLPHVELKDYEEEINQVKEFSLELQQPPEEFDGNNEQIKLGLKFWETWGQVKLFIF